MHAVKKCLTKRGPSCSRCREGARIIRFVVPMKSSKQVSLWIKKTLKKQNWLYISSTRSQLLVEKLKKDEGYVFLILANHEINLWHTCRPMVDSYLLAIGHSSSKQKKKKKLVTDILSPSCLFLLLQGSSSCKERGGVLSDHRWISNLKGYKASSSFLNKLVELHRSLI